MAHPMPTKGFLKLSSEAHMLFAPFGCTHPPPPVPSFFWCKLSHKGSDITS